MSTASRLPQIACRLTARLPRTVDARVRGLAVASLIGQTLLVVTGGAVRLTASGLGCPTWPRCTDTSLVNTPEMGIHGFIEFGNRLLTFALAAVAALMLVYLWNLRKERRDLFLLALGLLASIPAQAARKVTYWNRFRNENVWAHPWWPAARSASKAWYQKS